MTGHWIDTTTDEEARLLDRGMWDIVSREEPDGTIIMQASGPAPENGEFWTDALDRIKDDPDQRYAMARRHLPLPAAWREMAIALRTKIRTARKERTGYEDLLRDLHHLAAMDSYASYGIIERVPYARLSALELPYTRIGCDCLSLLGVTDCKWMRELWGEPEDHKTAADLYADMLAADIGRIKKDTEAEREARSSLFLNELLWNEGDATTPVESSAAPAVANPQPPMQKSRGLWGWLLGR